MDRLQVRSPCVSNDPEVLQLRLAAPQRLASRGELDTQRGPLVLGLQQLVAQALLRSRRIGLRLGEGFPLLPCGSRGHRQLVLQPHLFPFPFGDPGNEGLVLIGDPANLFVLFFRLPRERNYLTL